MKRELEQLIGETCKKLFDTEVLVVLTRPDPQFGDFATNIALQLTKKIDNPPDDGPRAIATQIADQLKSNKAIVEATVAGPGFLNITVANGVLHDMIVAKPTPAYTNTKVVIETNNPNPFKAMHIGHAFNAILADGLANFIEAGDAEVVRVSYHGDVGLHVGKSMYSLLEYVGENAAKLEEISPEERNSFMSRMYAEGSKVYKESADAKTRIDVLAQQSFTLEDPLYKQVYETCKAWSFDAIDQVMKRIGNQPISSRYLESQADARGVAIVREHPEVFIESNGAYVFPGSKYGSYDNAFVSSTGRGLYAARDLGLMTLKHDDHHADKSYIVTAEEQRDYFVGVIKAAEMCLPELTGVTTNISTGTVKLSTGKMSSREGDVLEVGWLFEQVAAALIQNGGQANDEMIASALRYQFLKVKIGGDVVFDVDEAVSLQGNSGPYLQYAHARAASILRKHEKPLERSVPTELQPSERLLVRKLSMYAEAVELATKELSPHHLCTYLFELSQEFNRFYEKNKVIGDEREAQRLTIVSDYKRILGDGLGLLGIVAPEQM